MSQLTRHPAYLLIEDTLDALGQKYRVLRLLRGVLLFSAGAAVLTFAAALAAHLAGSGMLATIILYTWIALLLAGAVAGIVLPLFIRPRSVEVARLVEGRIPELHNGLTNGVLLAQASDLESNPWTGSILNEIMLDTRGKPLGHAVTLRDLRGLAIAALCIVLPLLGSLAIPKVRTTLQQGFRQMFNPTVFVPRLGKIKLLDVQPTQTTLKRGATLEITALAEDPDGGLPQAKLVFEGYKPNEAALSPSVTEEKQLRYAFRIDRVEEPLRFRLEVGDTQSDWCVVNVVKKVELEQIVLQVQPPTYTNKGVETVSIKAADLGKTPIAVLEGSRVQMAVVSDVSVKGALLQLDGSEQFPMEVSEGGRRFSQTLIVMKDVEAAALLTEAGQVLARLPDPPLHIACTKDQPPAVEMKWPTQNGPAAPKQELKVHALMRDDLGLTSARVLMGIGAEQPLSVVEEKVFPPGTAQGEITVALKVPDNVRVHGQVIRVQVEALDGRNFAALVGGGPGAPASASDTGPQRTASPVFEITFRDPEQIARERKEEIDRLRTLLMEMLKKQQDLHTLAVAWEPQATNMPQIQTGQGELRRMMAVTASEFPFQAEDKIVQKVLQGLVVSHAKDAEEFARAVQTEPVAAEQVKQNKELQTRQRRIIDALEALLSRMSARSAPATQPLKNGGDLDNQLEQFKELDEALKKFLAEEKRILDAMATLAKKPVDQFDADDKKLLEELKKSQEKMDAFMQEKLSDYSKLAEQDQANASLLKEALEVYSEVTMAKDALKKDAKPMDIPLEEMGMELAKEISSNLEKWLMDKPDREKWNQEDMVGKQDIPMAELPKELEDMVGELMEEQEDLFEEMEDTAANWADSLDKGAGWDAADGPIANMSAKGVTGNQQPNNNEMNGRSGEGRSGKSSGEMVEETATGKGGRNTPTRLDPTPFAQGQIKDESKDPVGGATGGGKISGQGGAGLEGPVPGRDLKEKMERLAGKQAELRNKTERLALEKKLGSYENFKLMQAGLLMRKVESDIHANRYNNALRRRDVILDTLDTSKLLLGSQIHVQKDTSPSVSDRLEDELHDVTNGQLPAAWSEALKEYYRKLGQQ